MWPGDAIWSHRSGPFALALAQVMSCWLGDTKAWPEPMMTSHWHIVVKVLRAAKKFFTWVIWPAGRGPTGLRARVRNRGRLENQSHVVPKMGFQDGGEVSRWRGPNSDIYSQNYRFGLVYGMIYQFLGMEAKNYKFGLFCQQCHPSVAPGDADIRPRNASRIHTCHLFMLQFCLCEYVSILENWGDKTPWPKLLKYCFQ